LRAPFLLHLNSSLWVSKTKPYFFFQGTTTLFLYCAKVESITYHIYKIDIFLVGEYYSGAWVNHSFHIIKANKKGHYTKNYQKDKLMGAMNEMKNKTMKEKIKSPIKRGIWEWIGVGKTSYRNSGVILSMMV